MSLTDSKIRLVQNISCEIDLIKKGEISCADDMLKTRIEAMDRVWALECLIDEDDSTYSDMISFLYEQIKELTQKLTIKI